MYIFGVDYFKAKNVYSLKLFSMTRPGIEPRSPGPLAKALPTRLMSRLCVDFMLYLLGKYGVISCFIVFVSS